MFRTTMLAIVAVLALQSQDSLANHFIPHQVLVEAQQALQAQIDDLQAQIDALHAPDKFVFVTSSRQDGNVGGLAGADQICNVLASNAGLPGIYLAWLSDSATSPDARFTRPALPYVRVDGVQVAASFADLTDGLLDAPIALDENGVEVPQSSIVWTATDPAGLLVTGCELCTPCNDWTSVDPLIHPIVGFADRVNGGWTEVGSVDCSNPEHLYCFRQ